MRLVNKPNNTLTHADTYENTTHKFPLSLSPPHAPTHKQTHPVEIWSKIMAPLTHAMRLVDHKPGQHPVIVQLVQ